MSTSTSKQAGIGIFDIFQDIQSASFVAAMKSIKSAGNVRTICRISKVLLRMERKQTCSLNNMIKTSC